jgi:uncharacterized repeat protein (TIGR01451 family)
MLTLLLFPALPAASQSPPIVEYPFNGTFTDVRGGSTVTVHPDCPGDPCNTAAGTSFGTDAGGGFWQWSTTNARGGGFTVDVNRDLGHTYSVGVRFSFSELSSWRKIIDYKNRVDDTGFYLYNGQIEFYPKPRAETVYAPNEVLDLIAVRQGSSGSTAGTFTVYVIGEGGTVTKELEIDDPDGDSIPAALGGKSRLGFFHDDLDTSAEATPSGKVWSVKIWDRALTEAELKGALDNRVADLGLTKSASRTTAEISDLVTYTLTVTNAGPDAAPGVMVTDQLPSQVSFSSGTSGCSHANGKVTCSLGEIASGDSATAQVVVAVTAAGTVTNTAKVASAAADEAPGNNTASATFTATARETPTERLSGATRIETAILASETTFEDLAAQAVVLARADDFPDALAGGALAVTKNGPMLLNPTDALLDNVLAEIQRILPPGGPVYLLGGRAALSQAVEDQLTTAGFDVRRRSGADRYATAIAIAEELDPSALFLATGFNYPDALAAGAAAAEVGGALLLTADRSMHPATAAFIAANPTLPRYAAGGQAADADPTATPFAGADRYATALLIADEFFPEPVAVGIATGTGFADALAGVAHIGRRHGPMLLSAPTFLPMAVQGYLEVNADTIEAAFLYGGEKALSADVEAAVLAAID